MNSSKMTEGVGKKIVEALKQQSDIEIVPVKESTPASELTSLSSLTQSNSLIDEMVLPQDEVKPAASFRFNTNIEEVDSALKNSMLNHQAFEQASSPAVEELDLPANVAVLRQLITKIPSSVSKQTGALIIKQTMEALGISMTNVLQEAQQVQETLTQTVRECQNSVLEHKKQINLLEVQAQKYQKQFAAINDIISLFIQTNN